MEHPPPSILETLDDYDTSGIYEAYAPEEPLQTSSIWRRAIAFFLDAFVGMTVSWSAFLLLGLLVPLDRIAVWGWLGCFAVLWCAYFTLFPLLLGNTPGKFALGICTFSTRGIDLLEAQQLPAPKAHQHIIRAFFLGLWPLEALILLLTRGQQRIGDMLASTAVIKLPAPRIHGLLRLPLTIAAGALGVYTLFTLTPHAAANTQLHTAAIHALCRNPSHPQAGKILRISLPHGFSIQSKTGSVSYHVQGTKASGSLGILQQWSPGGWKPLHRFFLDLPPSKDLHDLPCNHTPTNTR